MNIHYHSEKNYFYGELEFSQVIEQKEVAIGSLYSFHENGFYIDWGISQFGFGQFSMGYSLKEKMWYINNECMGPNTCSMIVDTLEKAIRLLDDDKLTAMLNIFLKKLQANSLAEGLHKIWNQAKLD